MNPQNTTSAPLRDILFEGTSQAIVAINDQGRIVSANRAALESTGRAIHELLAADHHDALGHADHEGRRFTPQDCPICAHLRSGQHHRCESYSFHRAGDEAFPIDIEIVPGDPHSGEILAVVAFSDMTERRKLQQHMLHAQNLQSIGQLASGVAHEINTPIQYINDNLQFLRGALNDLGEIIQQSEEMLKAVGDDKLLAQYQILTDARELGYLLEEAPQAIAQSIEGTERVSAIVRAMKEFAHPAELSLTPIDLNRVVTSSVTVARNEWKHVAEVDTQLDASLPLTPCLGNEMHQVILNLIINAVHAVAEKYGGTREKGRITIQTRSDGDHAEIRIADTGTGIPERVRRRMFDPFFTTKSVGKGTGQGLALARSVVVEKHSGTIEVETTVGEGATFIIRIPFEAAVDEAESCQAGKHEACVVC